MGHYLVRYSGNYKCFLVWCTGHLKVWCTGHRETYSFSADIKKYVMLLIKLDEILIGLER